MKKIIGIVLIMLLGCANQCFARTLTATEFKNSVVPIINQDTKKYVDAVKIEAEILTIPFANIQIPDGKTYYEVTSFQDKFTARDIKVVKIYVGNNVVAKYNVPVKTKVYKNILVASMDVERDKTITREVSKVETRECSQIIEHVVTQEALSKDLITKKYFTQGDILDRRFLKMKPDVQRNGEVQAFFKTDDLLISITARAMTEGMVGDYVTVQNDDYRKVYRAKVIGENKVLINI